MSDINQIRLQVWLQQSSGEGESLPPKHLDELSSLVRAAGVKAFNTGPQPFTLRMSNIGRPLCQLQLEKAGAQGTAITYSDKFRFFYGDMIESAVIPMLKVAGVNVTSQAGRVSWEVAGVNIEGTYDITIDNVPWDIKSASPASFRDKFQEGSYTKLLEYDSFGYGAQAVGYAEALKTHWGGWIGVNKNDGAISFLPVTEYEYGALRDKYIPQIYHTVESIKNNAPFKRQFTDEPEIHYRKATGNRVLHRVCSMCKFKKNCWPDAKPHFKLPSKEKSSVVVDYTYIHPDYEGKAIENAIL